MYADMCVCMYADMYVCMLICMYVQITLWDTVNGRDGFMGEIIVNVNKREFLYHPLCVCMCVCVCVCMAKL